MIWLCLGGLLLLAFLLAELKRAIEIDDDHEALR